MAKIAAKPLEAADVRLNTVVTSVTARKTDEKPRGKVELSIQDGEKLECDIAVITAPLGWLKHHIDAIQPLSGRICSAVKALSFGNLEKVQALVQQYDASKGY